MIREYLFSIICISIISSILLSLPSGNSQKILSLICGITLSIIILRPFLSLKIDGIQESFEMFSSDTDELRAIGEDVYQRSLASIIQTECETYILQKANMLSCDISAEVTLTSQNPPVPEHVKLYGSVSPYAKSSITKMIERDLGIPKERQQWIG